MNKKSILLKCWLVMLALIALSCSDWSEHFAGEESETNNLFHQLKAIESAAEFVTALEITSLNDVLSGSEVYTVFVPPSGSFDGIEGEELKTLVGNHIVFGRYYLENMKDSLSLRAVSGKFYLVENDQGNVIINNRESLIQIQGNVVDQEARNGVIHNVSEFIDVVPNIEEQFSTLDPEIYSIFLENYNKYDSIVPDRVTYKMGFNDAGGVILTTEPYWVYPSFNAADEENGYTLLIPDNESILKQRAELIELNGGDESKISPLYYTRLIRNQMLRGAFNKENLYNADTIITEGENWVVGKKLNEQMYGDVTIASNGYIFEASDLVYKPIAADFIDSIVYEAEWSLGFDGHQKTLIYRSEMKPSVGGNGKSINHHLFANSLLTGNSIDMFVPNMFKGLYKLKMAYQWSNIDVGIHSEEIPITSEVINLQTFVTKDINNQDPNYWAYGDVGYVYLPEDGNLHLGLVVDRGIYAALMIDKFVLIPLEY